MSPRPTKAQQQARLEADARNRAVRAFLQGLALDVLAAVALVLAPLLAGDGDIEWRLLGLSLCRTAAAAAASYVMRRFVDPSRIPTPLPADDPGEPAE